MESGHITNLFSILKYLFMFFYMKPIKPLQQVFIDDNPGRKLLEASVNNNYRVLIFEASYTNLNSFFTNFINIGLTVYLAET